jgi:hypothetical protein
VVGIVEPLALIRVDELVALLGVDDPLVPVKTVVAGDSPCPLVLVKTVEPVSVVLVLERIVVCVTPVVPRVLKEKRLLRKEDFVANQ